jgi:hypothetical protein
VELRNPSKVIFVLARQSEQLEDCKSWGQPQKGSESVAQETVTLTGPAHSTVQLSFVVCLDTRVEPATEVTATRPRKIGKSIIYDRGTWLRELEETGVPLTGTHLYDSDLGSPLAKSINCSRGHAKGHPIGILLLKCRHRRRIVPVAKLPRSACVFEV